MLRAVWLQRVFYAVVCCLLAAGLLRCAAEPEAASCEAGCEEGLACHDGGCIDEACVGVACAEGQVCTRGDCVQAPVSTEEPEDVTAQWGRRQDLGASCASDMDCFSNHCVDFVCCDTACDGACEACDVSGKAGTCSVLEQGATCDDGSACTTGDTCDGQSAAGCTGTPLTCNSPPNECHQPQGTCSEGTCGYAPRPAGTACTDDGNPCTVDACDASGACAHPAVAAGTACGAGSVCTDAAACAAGCWIGGQLFAPGATNPAGPCQVCNPGVSTSSWSFKPAATVCRESAGACDVAETCTGSSAACPGDARVASGTVCRTSAGACDPAEVCNGSSVSCPADALASSGTQCRGAAGACDVAEHCDGSTASCPGDIQAQNGSSCGTPSTGSWSSCDADACGGSGTQSRSVTSYTCNSGTCGGATTWETRSCSRPQVSCPGASYGSWSGCSANACGGSGTRSRTVTEYYCSGGGCVQDSYTETQGCSVPTVSCPGSSYGAWSACSANACGGSGTQSRTVTSYSCSGGTCIPSSWTESQSCSRPTVSCPGSSYGAWSACNANACGGSGTQSRTVTDYYCSGGGCQASSRTETQGCSVPTVTCPGPSYGAWSACSASTCGGSGTQSRTVTTYSCSGGSCSASTSTETQSCTSQGGSCPPTSYGTWGACEINSNCGPGWQYRTVTSYSCTSSGCVPSSYLDAQQCPGNQCPWGTQCACGGDACLRPGEHCP